MGDQDKLVAEAHELASKLAGAVARTCQAKQHFENAQARENELKDKLHRAIGLLAKQIPAAALPEGQGE